MSFDLAFWVGEPPADDASTAADFERLHALHLTGSASAPRPELLAFLAEITRRFRDIVDLPDDQVDDGVWSDGPLLGNASGPNLYLGVVWSRVDEVVPFLVEVATRHALIVFDPQSGQRLA